MVLIIGDSHSRVLQQGQEALPKGDPKNDYKIAMLGIGRTFLKSFSVPNGGRVEFRSSRLQERLLANCGCADLSPQVSPIFLSLGFHGVYFFNSSLWNDFTLLHNTEGRHFLSEKVFDLMVLRFNYHILNFVTELRDRGMDPVVIAAPALSRTFLKKPKIAKMSSAELELVEERYRTAFANALKRRNVPWIAPPAAAMKDGRLDECFLRSNDAREYHGSPAYGALVLCQIEDYLAQTGENSASPAE